MYLKENIYPEIFLFSNKHIFTVENNDSGDYIGVAKWS